MPKSKMDASLVKKVKEVGFDHTWWNKYAAESVRKDKKVSDALKACNDAMIQRDGSFNKHGSPQEAHKALACYDGLKDALVIAKKNCGSLQGDTKAAIEEYLKVIKRQRPDVLNLARLEPKKADNGNQQADPGKANLDLIKKTLVSAAKELKEAKQGQDQIPKICARFQNNLQNIAQKYKGQISLSEHVSNMHDEIDREVDGHNLKLLMTGIPKAAKKLNVLMQRVGQLPDVQSAKTHVDGTKAQVNDSLDNTPKLLGMVKKCLDLAEQMKAKAEEAYQRSLNAEGFGREGMEPGQAKPQAAAQNGPGGRARDDSVYGVPSEASDSDASSASAAQAKTPYTPDGSDADSDDGDTPGNIKVDADAYVDAMKDNAKEMDVV